MCVVVQAIDYLLFIVLLGWSWRAKFWLRLLFPDPARASTCMTRAML
jgi:hypothetical protein